MPRLRDRREAAAVRGPVSAHACLPHDAGAGDPEIDTRHTVRISPAVSDAGVNVAAMSTHVCVWFEDSWPDHVCVCGARAVVVMDELGDTFYAVLDDAPEVPHQRLPLSA